MDKWLKKIAEEKPQFEDNKANNDSTNEQENRRANTSSPSMSSSSLRGKTAADLIGSNLWFLK